MANTRFTHRQCLLVFTLLLIVECLLNIVYNDDIMFNKVQKARDSNVTEVKGSTDKFLQLMKYCSNISIRRSDSVRAAVGKRIKPSLINSTSGPMGELLVIFIIIIIISTIIIIS